MSHASSKSYTRLFTSALFLALAISLSVVSVAAQTATFAERDYPFIVNNHVAADFNGDGKADLAGTGLNVLVMLNNGDGTFSPAVAYPAGPNPQDIAVGDFNGDGKPDLIVTNNDPQIGVTLLLGNGDGTFGAPISFPNVTGMESPSIVVADFNHDAKLDVAIAHPIGCYTAPCVVGRTVSIMLGNGDGTFQPPQQIDVGVGPVKLVVGDFNGDGNNDMAIAASAAKVFILLGVGDGTFVQQPALTLVPDPLADNTDIKIGDFNRDGIQDLVVASPFQGGRTIILLGIGNGTFQQPSIIFDPDSQFPQDLTVADFNGDGIQDIALGLGYCCSAPADGFLNILFGNGDGTFKPIVHYLAPNAATSSSGGVVVAADFNGDGKKDIALQITGATPHLAVLMNSTGVVTAPLAFGSITATPSSVSGGALSSINISLAPGAVAPAGGLQFAVSSGNPSVVAVPSTAFIAAGSSSVQFNASTSSVTSTQAVTIKTSNNKLGVHSVALTVTPPPASAITVLSLTLTPSTVTGGNTVQGKVTLSATATAATTVNLASSSTLASVPVSVSVAAGSSSASFAINTATVTSPASATISATLNGTTRTSVLTINPASTPTADTVAVTLAEYDTAKLVLRLQATSTSASATLQAFVTSSGQLIGTLTSNGGGRYGGQFNSSVNPQNVTVRSSLGGSAARVVTAK